MSPMHPRAKLVVFSLILCALSATGCKSPTDLLYAPKATDPLDGYEGSLTEAGINTSMDWGPKQTLLLSEFKTLTERHSLLEKDLAQKLAENQNLKTQLGSEGSALQKERALRAQAEAETEMLRQRRRELEARILSLSIEKAKLEQQNLLSKIEAMRQSMEPAPHEAAEASATPSGGR